MEDNKEPDDLEGRTMGQAVMQGISIPLGAALRFKDKVAETGKVLLWDITGQEYVKKIDGDTGVVTYEKDPTSGSRLFDDWYW